MISSINAAGFVNVTELARVAGCDFDVWFGHSLREWCQHGEIATGLWSKAGGLLCSLSCVPEETLQVGGAVQLKTAGQKLVVDVKPWARPSHTRTILVSLLETDELDPGLKRIATTCRLPSDPAATKPKPIPFYFICELCDAKWFAETRAADCPRCRTRSCSQQQLAPPWWNDRS